MILELITIASASVNISVGCLIFFIFFKLKYIFQNIKMNAEDLLKDISLDTPDEQHDLQQESKRERISAIIAGGGSRQYLGRELQLSDIDKMTPQEVDKLYCRYEARLGASMTKTLGNSFINLYVMGVSKYFNVINPPKLLEDLEEDPFINHALTSICCELYYKYGMYSSIQMKCQGGNKYALSITVKFDQSTRKFGRISFARLFKFTKHIALLFYLLSPYLLSCMRVSRNVRTNMHIIKTITKFCAH